MATDTQASNNTFSDTESKDPEQIEAEIEAAREDLSNTVNELSEKLDVKAQAQQRAQEFKERARTTMHDPQARNDALKSATPILAGVAGVALLVGLLRRVLR